MSKRTRTLLISAIALVVLAALLTVLLLSPAPSTGDDDNTPQDTTVSLVSKTGKITVSSVKVKTPDETFTIATDKDGTMTVQGYEDLPGVDLSYESLATALLEIEASRLIADAPEHPEDFGFNGNTSSVDVAYSDNTTFAFELGDVSPSGEGRYLRKAGSTAIYLVDTTFANTVAAKSTTYLSKTPFTCPETKDNDETVVMRDVVLSGSVRKEPVAFQISSDPIVEGEQSQIMSGFYLTKPYLRSVISDTDLIDASSYYGFAANDIAKVRPTEADLKAYGFNTPYSTCVSNICIQKKTTVKDKDTGKDTTTVSFRNNFNYTVKLGNESENGFRYAITYIEDEMVPLLYLVDPKSLVWTETQYNDLADTLLFFTYVYQVDKMTVTLNDKTTVFELTHNLDAEESSERMKVISNGRRLDNEAFRTMYAAMLRIYRNGSIDKLPASKPTMRIDIETNTSIAHGGWIELYQHSAGKYAALHDTGELYLVDAKDVEQFIMNYEKFLEDQKIG